MNVRPCTMDDLESVTGLLRTMETSFRGRSHFKANDLLEPWSRVSLAEDTWLFEEGSAPVAYGMCELWGDTGACFGVVAPDARGRGLGSALLDRLERRSAERDAAKVHTYAFVEDEAARALFESRGYREVRRFWEMAIELTEPPLEVPLGGGLVLEEFREGEERAFYDATVESFQDHWNWHATEYERWIEMRRGQHRDEHGPLWFVVRDGDELAAVVRNEADRNGGGYVGLIGVRRAWRGQGLAKALLQGTFSEFWKRGTTRVTLDVDADSPTGATHLYERVGMHVEACGVVFEKT